MELLDVKTAAARSGKAASTIRHAIRVGHLKAVRVGARAYAITPTDLEAWIADPNAHKPGKKRK